MSVDSDNTTYAVRWSAIGRYGTMFIQLISSFALARLLDPKYFGLMAMAGVFVGVSRVLSEMGLSAIIIQKSDLNDRLLSTLFWFNLLVCCVITLLAIISSPVVARLYSQDEVQAIFAFLSLTILGSAFEAIPKSLMQKNLELKKLAIRELLTVLVASLTGVGMAIQGFGVWSLVTATLAGKTTSIVLINLVNPWLPNIVFNRAILKECFHFGGKVMLGNLLSHLSRSADNLIVGVFLGDAALGLYDMGYKLMQYPRIAVTQVANRVLFPKMAQSKSNDKELSRILSLSTQAIACISFPMMGGLMVLVTPFVEVVLGSKWIPAIPVIMILAPVGAMQSLWSAPTQLLLAKGRADLFLRWNILNSLFCIAAFLVGVNWGLVGVASCYAIMCFIWIPVTFRMGLRLLPGSRLMTIFKGVTPYAIVTFVMMCGTKVFVLCVQESLAEEVMLFSSVAFGVVFYAALVIGLRLKAASFVMNTMGLLR